MAGVFLGENVRVTLGYVDTQGFYAPRYVAAAENTIAWQTNLTSMEYDGTRMNPRRKVCVLRPELPYILMGKGLG